MCKLTEMTLKDLKAEVVKRRTIYKELVSNNANRYDILEAEHALDDAEYWLSEYSFVGAPAPFPEEY